MKRNVLTVVLLLGVMIIIAVAVSLLVPSRSPVSPFKPMPDPNGYDGLVQAGQTLTGSFADYKTLGHEELLALVEANTNALRAARQALELECQVPLQFSSSYMATTHLGSVQALRTLAQALAAEGRLAEMENRPAQAAKSYLNVVRLGTQSARGGLVVDLMIGTAIESIGVKHLKDVSGRLDATSSRETAKALEALDARREPWSDVAERERIWSRRSSGGIRYRLAALFASGSLKTSMQQAEQRVNRQTADTRHLLVRLAARAYELDKNKPATRLEDLVPEYLKAIPQDPVTDTNMAYVPQ